MPVNEIHLIAKKLVSNNSQCNIRSCQQTATLTMANNDEHSHNCTNKSFTCTRHILLLSQTAHALHIMINGSS